MFARGTRRGGGAVPQQRSRRMLPSGWGWQGVGFGERSSDAQCSTGDGTLSMSCPCVTGSASHRAQIVDAIKRHPDVESVAPNRIDVQAPTQFCGAVAKRKCTIGANPPKECCGVNQR